MRDRERRGRIVVNGRDVRLGLAVASVVVAAPLALSDSPLSMPFQGCTFYSSRFESESFADAAANAGCADFSAVRGRAGCQKIKGPCPACVKYPGDHVQMWLPDYFIEVTSRFGKSVFSAVAAGRLFAQQLAVAANFWRHALPLPAAASGLSDGGAVSPSARETFWQARILTIPFGSWANTYPPLFASIGTGIPACFSAVSEFLPGQWNLNLADGKYAVAWAPVGIPMCVTALGAGAVALSQEVRARVGALSGGAPRLPHLPVDLSCGNPVTLPEALAKNALPSSDPLAPLTSGDLTKLCMGSWGNLVPRTGWIASEDPSMAALLAAYKFQSLAGDMHLNPALKRRSDDKWQIVYPPLHPSMGCFHPGSLLRGLPAVAEDPLARSHEVGHTYVIAVWRRRASCEEPLEAIGGWSADYKVNFNKNRAACVAAGAR